MPLLFFEYEVQEIFAIPLSYYFQVAALPEDEELVDPNPPVNVALLNQQMIDLDDRLFFQLEESRWCPELAVFGLKQQRPLKRSVIVID